MTFFLKKTRQFHLHDFSFIFMCALIFFNIPQSFFKSKHFSHNHFKWKKHQRERLFYVYNIKAFAEIEWNERIMFTNKSKQWKERTKCIIASFKVDHIVPLRVLFYVKEHEKCSNGKLTMITALPTLKQYKKTFLTNTKTGSLCHFFNEKVIMIKYSRKFVHHIYD